MVLAIMGNPCGAGGLQPEPAGGKPIPYPEAGVSKAAIPEWLD